MRIYYAVTAADHERAAAPGRRFAHVAYRIGEAGELLRRNLPLQTRTGLLSLSDRDAPALEHPEGLCGALMRECARRGYAGTVADFEAPVRGDLSALLALLDGRHRDTGRRLYVPEAYAGAAPGAAVLLCTAVSGGNFQAYLEEAAGRYGGRLALDAERLRMDFTLPAPSGEGEPLSKAEFDALADGKSVFFSPDLCARYFTCTKDGAGHFVLFDDADTLNRKLALGERYGAEAAFFQWPEVEDIAADLRTEQGGGI